ncbi:hypothetical protein QP356_15725, partial [Klebsiella grimontii]|nr:hypothetical protein [Klebsiella grimontii]
MTRLPESSSWEEEIELISRSERVAGGLDGPANRPLKSLANRTRYLKDQADTADESIAEKVSAVKTFAEGATLESPREEILFDSYRLVWTGEFPKTVLAGSTPQGTGGIGAGCWAYTSDAVIRQNLGSGDGLKWVGKCVTISALRAVEPTYAGQSITLRHAVSGGHEINCSLWYDADDLTTADDGYSIFVTAGGARWKADVSRGIDVRLAGLLADNSNLGTVLNAVINGEVNKIKAAGTIKGAITNIFIPASRKT